MEDDQTVAGHRHVAVLGPYSTLLDAALAVEQQARISGCVIQGFPFRHKWYYQMTHPPAEIGWENWTEIWDQGNVFASVAPRTRVTVSNVLTRSIVIANYGTSLQYKIVCGAGHGLTNIGIRAQHADQLLTSSDGTRERNVGWYCNGCDEEGGCGLGRGSNTDLVVRYRCDACDFDLCHACRERKKRAAKASIENNRLLLLPPIPIPAASEHRCTKCNDLLPWSPTANVGLQG